MAGFADTHSAASSDWAGGDGRRRRRPLQCRRSTWELQGEYAARGLISGETLLRQAKTTIANAKKMITVVNNRSELVEKLPESGDLQYTSGKNEGDLDEEVLRALFNWREDNLEGKDLPPHSHATAMSSARRSDGQRLSAPAPGGGPVDPFADPIQTSYAHPPSPPEGSDPPVATSRGRSRSHSGARGRSRIQSRGLIRSLSRSRSRSRRSRSLSGKGGNGAVNLPSEIGIGGKKDEGGEDEDAPCVDWSWWGADEEREANVIREKQKAKAKANWAVGGVDAGALYSWLGSCFVGDPSQVDSEDNDRRRHLSQNMPRRGGGDDQAIDNAEMELGGGRGKGRASSTSSPRRRGAKGGEVGAAGKAGAERSPRRGLISSLVKREGRSGGNTEERRPDWRGIRNEVLGGSGGGEFLVYEHGKLTSSTKKNRPGNGNDKSDGDRGNEGDRYLFI